MAHRKRNFRHLHCLPVQRDVRSDSGRANFAGQGNYHSRKHFSFLVQRVVKTAAGRIPVVACGTFAGSISDQAKSVKEIYNTGVDVKQG